jgi:PIN domain nuclease of toxin-antitoxin system
VSRLLLDTHLVLWWLSGDARLPQSVVERVQAPEAEVFVIQASLWEMAIKVSIHRQRPRAGSRWAWRPAMIRYTVQRD